MKREISLLFVSAPYYLILESFDGKRKYVRNVDKIYLLDRGEYEYVRSGWVNFVSCLDYNYIGIGSQEDLDLGIDLPQTLYK